VPTRCKCKNSSIDVSVGKKNCVKNDAHYSFYRLLNGNKRLCLKHKGIRVGEPTDPN